MERLKERIQIASDALKTLEELVGAEKPDNIKRDAAIQRFEYTFEATWKAGQRYLLIRHGLNAGSPKSVIRSCFENGIFNEEETEIMLKMSDDRNLTVHTYNMSVADTLWQRLPQYAQLLRKWIEKIK